MGLVVVLKPQTFICHSSVGWRSKIKMPTDVVPWLATHFWACKLLPTCCVFIWWRDKLREGDRDRERERERGRGDLLVSLLIRALILP